MHIVIETRTPNIEQSIQFYKSLNYTTIKENDTLYRFAVKDHFIQVNLSPTARTCLNIYGINVESVKNACNEFTLGHKETENSITALSPGGTLIKFNEALPTLNFDQANLQDSLLGTFAGVSLESLFFDQSLDFFLALGLNKTMGGKDQGWVALQLGEQTISIMNSDSCPHQFLNPSLTFFNGKNNLKIISEVRKKSIPIEEEITAFNPQGIADNIILREPGGVGFFIFSD